MTISSAAHFILYVSDQRQSTEFYSRALDVPPTLDVPGMTEFRLTETAVLGLMPAAGAAKLLGRQVQYSAADGNLKAELYLMVDDPDACHRRAIAAGAAELSPLQIRDWGHIAAYSVDRDGNVLAFAKQA